MWTLGGGAFRSHRARLFECVLCCAVASAALQQIMRGCKSLQTTSWFPAGKQGVFLEDFEVFPYVVAPRERERVSHSRAYNQKQAVVFFTMFGQIIHENKQASVKTNCFRTSSLVIATAAATGRRDCLFARNSSQQQLLTDCKVPRTLCFLSFEKQVILLQVKTFTVFAPNLTRAVANTACSSARSRTFQCLPATTT